jgi:hypothetical protein
MEYLIGFIIRLPFLIIGNIVFAWFIFHGVTSLSDKPEEARKKISKKLYIKVVILGVIIGELFDLIW